MVSLVLNAEMEAPLPVCTSQSLPPYTSVQHDTPQSGISRGLFFSFLSAAAFLDMIRHANFEHMPKPHSWVQVTLPSLPLYQLVRKFRMKLHPKF